MTENATPITGGAISSSTPSWIVARLLPPRAAPRIGAGGGNSRGPGWEFWRVGGGAPAGRGRGGGAPGGGGRGGRRRGAAAPPPRRSRRRGAASRSGRRGPCRPRAREDSWQRLPSGQSLPDHLQRQDDDDDDEHPAQDGRAQDH